MIKAKKICHVIHSLNYGGIQKLLYDLVYVQMKNQKVLPFVMIFKQGGEFENEYKKLGIKIVHLKLEKIYKINFTILNKINKAFELCDTIHFHNFHPIITPYASFFNKNVVYTEHGNFAFGRKKT